MKMRISKMAIMLPAACGIAFAQTDPAAACAALKQLQVPGVNLAVTKTEWFPAGSAPPGRGGPASTVKLPAYCRLDGMIDKRTGNGGATYGIGFAIALPQNWNGRFLLQGGGGLNGSVQFPLGASGAGADPVSRSQVLTPAMKAKAASTAVSSRISRRALTSRTSLSAGSLKSRSASSRSITAKPSITPTLPAVRQEAGKRC
jgi:Tannase and feruloyl esterase